MFRSILVAVCLAILSIAPAMAQSNPNTTLSNQAGAFPYASLPAARVMNAKAGPNILYTVPAHRKALVTDYWITNNTSDTIGSYPFLAIGAQVYRLGSDSYEQPAAIGHNYGSNGSKTIPIVLNAGESFGVSTSGPGITIWAKVIEFDETSPLNRADVRTWYSGGNYLLTVPLNASVSIGVPGEASINNPGISQTGMIYVNGSASTRTIFGMYVIPRRSAPGNSTQFGGFNSLPTGTVFAKSVPNLAPGDSIMILSDSSAAGQFAWVNYELVY